MAGYIRQDVTNNIADGNVINASDFDNEYNAIEAAFHATTGHTHDGTSAEGAPITKIGPAQDIVAGVSSLTPKTDNTIDLGSSTLEFKDLYIDGTANIDSLVADTADINAGTIDGVTIGGASAGAGSFTTLSASSTTTLSGLTASTALALNASKEVVSVTNTGTGNNVLSASPTLTGTVAGASLQLSSLTSGRVTYAGASGLLQDSTNLTFDGTSLTLGGNPTLSAGTANGVLYLNGSKVATSGSALTFDGTTLGIGTSGGGYRIAATAATNLAAFSDGSTQNLFLTVTGGSGSAGAFTFNANNGGALVWQNAGSEQMRLTSTGLGIGTSSPGYKLDVVGAVNLQGSSTFPTTGVFLRSADNELKVIGGSAGISFAAQSGASTYATINSAGNLGLGVPPSAWGSNFRSAIQGPYGNYALYADQSNYARFGLASNAFHNGTAFTYVNSSPAAQYQQFDGVHRWFTAPSGTAGNAISFTQSMTLDASGNLSLDGGGTYSVNNTKAYQVKDSGGTNRYALYMSGGVSPTAGDNLYLGTTINSPLVFFTNSIERARITSDGDLGVGTTSPIALGAGYTSVTVNGSTSGRFDVLFNGTHYGAFLADSGGAKVLAQGASNPLVLGTNNTERARITSGGDLLVGTTSNAAITGFSGSATGQTIQGGIPVLALVDSDDTTNYVTWLANSGGTTYLYSKHSSSPLVFGAANAERARINSGGYFKASDTGSYQNSAAAYHELRQSASDWIAYTVNSNAIPYGLNIGHITDANSTGSPFLACNAGAALGTLRAEIRSNGGIANYQGNDVNLSDRREKTNFAPAKPYLDTICAIPVQTFNYIDQSEDDPGLTLGVVAQDVQAVAPELVMESNWGTAEDPKMRLSIYQTDLQYALMKCIQELKAQNDELRARVAALEAQP